jgi:hypothetical protein
VNANLKPCPYRLVDDEGLILCSQIKFGDREVSPAICRACPIAQINCAHLRATLAQQTRSPLIVRWGNGKTEIWDDPVPPIALQRAACSAKTIPILSPRDCAGCAIRQAMVADLAPNPSPTRRGEKARVAPALITQAIRSEPGTEARTNIVAQKIIQVQEWLAKQKNAKKEEEGVMPIAVGARPSTALRMGAVGEERRVGWTD